MIISNDGTIAQFENGEKVVLPDTSYEWINASSYADRVAGRTILFRGIKCAKSDLEKFVDLYRSVGVEFGRGISEGDGAKIGYQYLSISLPYLYPQDFIDYHQCIYFDESGKFIQQGIWE